MSQQRLIRSRFVGLVALLVALSATACTRNRPNIFGEDAGADVMYAPSGFDPFAPGNQCANRTVPSTRVPGALVIVLDQSGSMSGSVAGSTRWDLATQTVRDVLNAAPDALSTGLLLFPSGSNCGVAGQATVAIGPLGTSRAPILSALAGDPNGGTTPLGDAVLRGYQLLDGISTRGGKGLLVVTDGEDNCGARTDLEYVHTEAARRLSVDGTLTYVVGLQTDNGFLSLLAARGGTRRNSTCDESCGGIASAMCTQNTDCSFGQTCGMFGFGIAAFRQCACANDSQCPQGFTCPTIPFGGNLVPRTCAAPNNLMCCHYSAQANNFRAELQTALEAVTGRLTSTCVFAVPVEARDFNPDQVNVGVTFAGQPRIVVPRDTTGAGTGSTWTFTDASSSTVTIHGQLCDRLRAAEATVEVVLGCPSVIP